MSAEGAEQELGIKQCRPFGPEEISDLALHALTERGTEYRVNTALRA